MTSVTRILKENESEESKRIPKYYKIYYSRNYGPYEFVGGYNIFETVEILDKVIYGDDCPSKIMVDEMIVGGGTTLLGMLYLGREEAYLEFKDVFYTPKLKEREEKKLKKLEMQDLIKREEKDYGHEEKEKKKKGQKRNQNIDFD